MLWSMPGYGRICLLKGGAWLLQPEAFDGATLRAAADGSVLRTFPDTLEVGWGPIAGTKVAVTTKEDFGDAFPWEVLHVLDVATGEIYGRWVPYLAAGGPLRVVSYIRLHPDGRRVAVIGARAANFDSWFAVGDVLTGQTLLEHQLVYGAGQISISDDGRYAIATDPSLFLIYDSTPSLDIFDLTTNTHLRRFGGSDGNPEDGYMGYVAQSAFAPGINSVVTGPDPGVFKGIGAIGLIDLLQLRLVDYAFSPLHYIDKHGGITGAYMGGMTVGPRP